MVKGVTFKVALILKFTISCGAFVTEFMQGMRPTVVVIPPAVTMQGLTKGFERESIRSKLKQAAEGLKLKP